ncbi:hypothetical protein ON010_g16264 [Phytophthora cinnamomi]|nr:hypothetical protein ON010_g16264 [Phytophthora cinnamomi]
MPTSETPVQMKLLVLALRAGGRREGRRRRHGLRDSVDFKASLLDSGADASSVSCGCITKLHKRDYFVPLIKRGQPQELDPFGPGTQPEHVLRSGKDVAETPLMRAQQLREVACFDDQPEENVSASEHDERFTSRVFLPETGSADQNAVLVRERLLSALDIAQSKGLRGHALDMQRETLANHKADFCVMFGLHPPVNVPSLRVQLKHDATTVRCFARRYAPMQRAFVDVHAAELDDLGIVERTYSSRWASAPCFVPKPPPADFRMCMNSRVLREGGYLVRKGYLGCGCGALPRERVQDLVEKASPSTAADLQQFVCAMNRMRSSITEFARVAAPLYSILEKAMQTRDHHTKRHLSEVQLSSVGWDVMRLNIRGGANVWGDLLSRWGASSDTKSLSRMRRLAIIDQVSLLQDLDFEWPSYEGIVRVQKEGLTRTVLIRIRWDEELGIFTNQDRCVWIPESEADLQQMLCAIAHAAPSCRWCVDPTAKSLSETFVWETLSQDVSAFVAGCIHCLNTQGKEVPRPYGETLRATKPNEILYIDFLSMPRSASGTLYVLVPKDNMSGYVALLEGDRPVAKRLSTKQ